MFSLHPQLELDTISIGDLPLSKVLLMNNAELPWLILVPRKATISEWHSLEPNDQLQLHHESIGIGALLMTLFNGDKLNIGAIGNLVPQLHLHHVVRFKNDSVWPLPVWGNIISRPYSVENKEKIIAQLECALSQHFNDFEKNKLAE
ncbi:MAG: diadenosine tetraphosphate (Ap4A) HIT family hydrolase [Arenicella sp.]|jgi:diadenosine tetraphosphate (Ap4A) HIT family hydrolase